MMIVWFAWIAGVTLLVLLSLGYAMTIPMMRRRVPDTPDNPLLHGMPGQDVTFPSRDGLTLGGWWIPAGGTPKGTVIMCPGQNGSMDKDVPQAKPLYDAGFNVLMFDFRGHGRSEGDRVTMGALEQADLRGAIDYLGEEHQITRVGVLGFSMGAGVALMTASYDDRISALVVDGAYTRLSRILRAWITQRGLPNIVAGCAARLVLWLAALRVRHQVHRANPVDMVPDVTAPVLFIHAELDPFVSSDEISTLAGRTSGPTEVWRVLNADHREAFRRHPDDYNRRVIAWFEQHLSTSDHT
ncbi:MAG: alpha/beta fold hydrolase [Anaerolineae bacterium]|nr:alpha/beta fold hydrolase [Anaerolineae bacterium]